MKSISLCIVLVYILVPLMCFAHPNAWDVEVPTVVFDIFTAEFTDKQDMDDCGAAFCLSEHTPFVYRANHSVPEIRLYGSSLIYSVPQVFIPIFVPPQNKP